MADLFNLELEAELLSLLLFDNQLVEAVTDLVRAEDFAAPHHARIFDAIAAEVNQGNLANAVTLKPYFDSEADTKAFGGFGYLGQLSGMMSVSSATDLAKVSIVGTGMLNAPGYAAKMFRTLAENQINIEMITTSEIRITCIVAEDRVEEAVRALHATFQLDQVD